MGEEIIAVDALGLDTKVTRELAAKRCKSHTQHHSARACID